MSPSRSVCVRRAYLRSIGGRTTSCGEKTSFELGDGTLHYRIALPLGKAARIV